MQTKCSAALRQFLQGCAIGLCYLALILLPRETSQAAIDALSLCARVIVPSLFPFFVCANLFCALRLAAPLEARLSRIMRPIFGISGAGAAALVLGLTGGYPSGAQAVGALYSAGALDRREAEKLLAFCNNCGPAFIFGIVGQSVFHSAAIGLLLYLVHILSALLCGVLQRGKHPAPCRAAREEAHVPAPAFSDAFTQSVKKAGQTALEVCMFVVVFGVLSALFLLPARRYLPASVLPLLYGVLELSGGAYALAGTELSVCLKFILSSFLLAFGGLSVHAQTRAVLHAAGLDDLPVFRYKLRHGFLAALLSVPVAHLFHLERFAAPAFAAADGNPMLIAAELLFCGALCLHFRKMAGSNFARHRV